MRPGIKAQLHFRPVKAHGAAGNPNPSAVNQHPGAPCFHGKASFCTGIHRNFSVLRLVSTNFCRNKNALPFIRKQYIPRAFSPAYSVEKICRQTPIHLSRGQWPPKTAASLQAGRKTRARFLRCLKTPPRFTVGKSFPFAPDGKAKALFYFPRALAHNRHRGKQHRLPWPRSQHGSGAVSAANTLRGSALRSTQRFQTRTATRSVPSCPATCRAMAQGRLRLSTRRVCAQAPKEACALGGTLPLYYISAPPACQRPSSKTSPIVEMAATFMNCFVQSPAGRRFPGRHSKALPGPPQ